MHAVIARVSVAVALSATGAGASESFVTPGLYRIEVRIALPNVQDVAAPIALTRCIRPADLESGQAFFVRSDNPLRNCDQIDYQVRAYTVSYRIACPGPNRGSAVPVFTTTSTAYRGSIKMNLGGKNMTMSETQIGERVGECE